MREPNGSAVCNARSAIAAVRSAGWSYVFTPHRPAGERLELKDPGNRGRLHPDTRAAFNRHKAVAEMLIERAYVKKQYGEGSDASALLDAALRCFPGSRIVFR